MKRVSDPVMVGDMPVGGGAPVSIQSMTNTDTSDVEATVRQINSLFEAGCELVRVAVPDEAAANSLGAIKKIFLSLLLQIFILIINWLSWRLIRVWTRLGLTRALLGE